MCESARPQLRLPDSENSTRVGSLMLATVRESDARVWVSLGRWSGWGLVLPMPTISPTGEPLGTRTSGGPPLGRPVLSYDLAPLRREPDGLAVPVAVRKSSMGDYVETCGNRSPTAQG
jgi:hypothetical protein